MRAMPHAHMRTTKQHHTPKQKHTNTQPTHLEQLHPVWIRLAKCRYSRPQTECRSALSLWQQLQLEACGADL